MPSRRARPRRLAWRRPGRWCRNGAGRASPCHTIYPAVAAQSGLRSAWHWLQAFGVPMVSVVRTRHDGNRGPAARPSPCSSSPACGSSTHWAPLLPACGSVPFRVEPAALWQRAHSALPSTRSSPCAGRGSPCRSRRAGTSCSAGTNPRRRPRRAAGRRRERSARSARPAVRILQRHARRAADQRRAARMASAAGIHQRIGRLVTMRGDAASANFHDCQCVSG